MARIKFSGVVSEVKGKLNGTVFSRNRGGAYMRNNKSGQTTNSAKSSQVKNKFGSLASRWRSLTVDQQNEWNAAGINYPTVNKFGDTRTPSGYELFMRLNGTLELMSLPIQTLPSLPKTISPLGAVSYNYPELFQIMPERGLNLDAMQIDGLRVDVYRTPSSKTAIELGNHTFVLFFELTNDLLNGQYVKLFYPKFTGYEDGEMRGFTIIRRSDGYSLIADLKDASSSNQWELDKFLGEFDPKKPHVIAISVNEQVPEALNIYLDGVFLDTVGNFGSAPTPLRWFREFQIGFTNTATAEAPRNYLKIGGYYEYEESLDVSTAKLVCNGYILSSLVYGCDLSGGRMNRILNEYDFNGAGPLMARKYGQTNMQIDSFTPQFVPAYVLTVENEGTTDEYIEVYATPPQSTGVSGTTARWVRIGSYIWGVNKDFDLENDLRAAFGFIRPNAEIQFYCRVVNTTNGQADQMKTTPPRKGSRFKAGSELTDRVN